MKLSVKHKRIFVGCAAAIILSVLLFELVLGGESQSMLNTNVNTDVLKTTVSDGYYQYLSRYGNRSFSGEKIEQSATENIIKSNQIEILHQFEGAERDVLMMSERSEVAWKIDVPKTGLYRIGLEYYPIKGNSASIERALKIDGKQPFKECSSLVFPRIWQDKTNVSRDETGNDMRPQQVENPRWVFRYFRDAMGYFSEDFLFYLEAGEHTVSFSSVKEPMVLSSLLLNGEEYHIPSYATDAIPKEQIVQNTLKNGYLLYEAEVTKEKSAPTLYPVSDRSSPATQPYDVSKIRLNTIGGEKWKYPGESITWEVDVPKAGYYHIGLRSRQNLMQGLFTNRRLLINGELPFQEAEQLPFVFQDAWTVKLLGDETPYLFYLKQGKNTITMETTLGKLGDVINAAEVCLSQLNDAYWRIMSITGSEPDIYRDYHLDKRIPDVLTNMQAQAKTLYKITSIMQEITGQKGEATSIPEQLAVLIDMITNEPDKIAKTFSTFKDSIGSLGNWINQIREQPLQIDYLLITEQGAVLPRAEKGAFRRVSHNIGAFLASFTEDYNQLNVIKKGTRPVTVWVGSGVTGGRDQAQVLKQLTDNYFTPQHNIPVNLQLVSPGTILSATLAGKGPDVALQIGGSDPVNYAMRKAVEDLTQFEDFDSISSRFYDSALLPFRYLNGVYALPETQSFPIMFYRKDIMQKLGVDIKSIQTWDDVIALLPILQKQHMNFGLPSIAQTAGPATIQSYGMFLYQNGGEFYQPDGKASALDSKAAVDAFYKWTDFYASYRLPVEYSFENRFRMGETPIGVADYTVYNLLSVSAPEIKGLWGMAPIPGIKDKNGNINNVAPSTSSGCILMSTAKDKNRAWEFMKWWTEAQTQIEFGNELESIMGAAARYNTANVEAFKQLPWPADEREALLSQWKNTRGIPEVPGGYYTVRYVDFAFRDVINDNINPRESLLDNIVPINEEIEIKRKEFGLD